MASCAFVVEYIRRLRCLSVVHLQSLCRPKLCKCIADGDDQNVADIRLCGVICGDSRAMSSMSWEHLSAVSISGLVLGACALTCAVCCCCRWRRQRRRRRSSYQRHDLHDDEDANLCACACCPSTSGLYACKYASMCVHGTAQCYNSCLLMDTACIYIALVTAIGVYTSDKGVLWSKNNNIVVGALAANGVVTTAMKI